MPLKELNLRKKVIISIKKFFNNNSICWTSTNALSLKIEKNLPFIKL